MSNALQVAAIMDALIAAITAAWGTVTIREDSEPRSFQELPLVTINWEEVHIDLGGINASVNSTNQGYQIEIIYFFAMPPALGTSAGKLSRLKAAYASQLIAQLQTGPSFAGVANFPLVERVSARERNPTFEGAAMLRMIFSCQVQALHH